MQHAHDVNASGHWPVEDQVHSNRDASEIVAKLGPSCTKPRKVGKTLEQCIKSIQKSPGGRTIVQTDIDQDITKVGAALAAKLHLRH